MTLNTPARPAPSLDEADTGPFWAATKDHRLTYQWCRDCETVVFFRRQFCPGCGGTDLEERDSAGRGTVYTFTVIRKSAHPFFGSIAPYVVAYIDLDEGFRLMAGVNADIDTLEVGAPVVVEWEDGETCSFPVFRPE